MSSPRRSPLTQRDASKGGESGSSGRGTSGNVSAADSSGSVYIARGPDLSAGVSFARILYSKLSCIPHYLRGCTVINDDCRRLYLVWGAMHQAFPCAVGK